MNRRRFAIGLVLFCTLVFLVSLVNAQESGTLIAAGDSMYDKFDNQKALEFYQQVLSQNPKDFDAIWRISRAYVDIGEHLPEAQQLAYFEKAKIFADSAISIKPNLAEGYTRRAIATGKISLFKGVWKSIGLVKSVRADCEKAILLNPNDQVALYVYARAHQKVAEKSKLFRAPLGLGWGSKEESKKLYEKALALEPTSVMFSLDYARLLVDMDQDKAAIVVLQKIPGLPITDEDDVSNKEEAKKLLEEISK